MTSFTNTTTNYPQEANTPIKRVKRNGPPTPNPPTAAQAKNYVLGDEWLDTSASPDGQWWKLCNHASGGVIWARSSGGVGQAETLTGNSGGAVPPDSSANINVIGDGSTVNIVGNPGTNTLTVGTTGSIASTYTEDSGSASPLGGILNIKGTSAQGILTSGASNTVTLTNADWTTSQKGVGVLSTNAQSIAGSGTTEAVTPASLGAKLGTQTAHGLPIGESTSSAFTWTAAPTAGQLLIGTSGTTDPTLGTLTAGSGISITNGSGSITIAARGSGVVSFFAYLSMAVTNATGDGSGYTIVFDSTQYNVGAGYSTGTGLFTAPVTGLYQFTSTVTTSNYGFSANQIIYAFVHSVGPNAYRFVDSGNGLVNGSLVAGINGSFCIQMTAGDTMGVNAAVSGGSKTITINPISPLSSTNTFFTGYLVG